VYWFNFERLMESTVETLQCLLQYRQYGRGILTERSINLLISNPHGYLGRAQFSWVTDNVLFFKKMCYSYCSLQCRVEDKLQIKHFFTETGKFFPALELNNMFNSTHWKKVSCRTLKNV
jgi:hypothetical protein